MDGEWLRIGIDGIVPVTWDTSKADGDPGTLAGYASVWNVVDGQDDVVVRGAFRKTLQDWRSSGRVIPLVLDHEHRSEGVIGSLASASEDSFGLKFAARFSATARAQDARAKAREGHLAGLSIFGPILKKSFELRDGREIRHLQELGLMEVSLTPFPANDRALVSAAKTTTKAGIPVHHTAVTDAGRWEAGANVDRISNDAGSPTLRQVYALVRSGTDPDTKAAYALPHHVVDADGRPGPAHIAAVRNALARLPQTQGIDDATRTAAERHLRAHLDDFNQRAAASLELPDGWAEDMRSALAIADPVASKAAVDRLVTSHYGAVLAGGYRHVEPADQPGPDTPGQPQHEEQGSASYALELIGETGEQAGGDSTPDSLADLLAPLDAAATSDELDQMMAELKEEK